MDAWGGSFGSAWGNSFGTDPVVELLTAGGASGVPDRRRLIYPDKHEPRVQKRAEPEATAADGEEETILHLLQ